MGSNCLENDPKALDGVVVYNQTFSYCFLSSKAENLGCAGKSYVAVLKWLFFEMACSHGWPLAGIWKGSI